MNVGLSDLLLECIVSIVSTIIIVPLIMRGRFYQTTIYFFIFTAYITISALLFLKINGYIDLNLRPTNKIGSVVSAVIMSYIDIKMDLYIYLWIFGLFVVPNVISYLCAGLFGYARSVRVSFFVRYFLLVVTKGLIAFSGAGFAILSFGIMVGVPRNVNTITIVYALFAIPIYLNISLLILLAYDASFIPYIGKFPAISALIRFSQRKVHDGSGNSDEPR
ncbi:hypothetical protein HLH26_08530 [Gluconacetobacter sp. 1b LMG 1731]|uniref:Uncharacterized protein n=1 Tax=Gluconacetobacter dulcium TaxID=2729096 RepID=A0A7W4IKM3_9PROT|nr:hypothetical protein [Gluconacetobacter dulcium]MBB2164586.1 hypothetical protein [Gluconacetobacter dulcium]MBB2193647.1 hypothetical protein [Gluconacetobacter dulcium]